MAWVAKGNKIALDFVYLCPPTVPCRRTWLVRPTTREFQEIHVAPDVPHDLEHAVVPDLTVHLLFWFWTHGLAFEWVVCHVEDR